MSRFDDFDFLDELEDKKKHKRPAERPLKRTVSSKAPKRPSRDVHFAGAERLNRKVHTDAPEEPARRPRPEDPARRPRPEEPKIRTEEPRRTPRKNLREEVAKHAVRKPEKAVREPKRTDRKEARALKKQEKLRASADRRAKKKRRGGFLSGFLHMSAGDHIVVSTGILVLGLAVITGSVYMGTRMMEQEIGSFKELGGELTALSQNGESGLIAVTDARVAALNAVFETEEVDDEDDEDEEIDNSAPNEIVLNITSVERDLKIKFINKRGGKLISGIPFEASVKDPDGKTTTYKDDDKDGIIYKKELKAGTYEVSIIESSALSDYKYSTGAVTVKVKDKIEYKKIDVKDEIKTESEVNVAKEDTAIQEAETAPALKDTVEWVESTKKAIGSDDSDGSGEYQKIDKDDITDPSTTAMAVSRFRALEKEETESSESESGESESKESESKESESKESESKESESKETETKETEKEKEEEKEKEQPKKEITGVSITSAPSSMEVGDSTTLNAKVSGKNLDGDESVKWSVDDSSVASIDSSGKLTARKAGTVKVTATSSSDSSVKDSCSVEVKSGVSLSLDTTSLSMKVGETASIKASVSRGSVEWSVGDKSIVTVEDGKITAKAKGETTVTVKAEEDTSVTDSCKITVSEKEGELTVTLDAEKLTVLTNETKELVATVSKESGSVSYTFESADKSIVTVSADGKKATLKGVKAGETTVTVTAKDDKGSASASCKVTVKLNPLDDDTSLLKDKDGNQVYIIDKNDKYVKATFADYYKYKKFYIQAKNVEYKYTGWQTIDGKTYFFTKDGKPVTGEQVIQGAKYTFDSKGVLQVNATSGLMGIDVSKWNGTIDWSQVKNSGVNYVIIRCGYRGSSSGALIQDPKFKANIKGAQAAGIKVGIYFFTQAVNEVEAVEEASMVLDLIKGYNISYPVFADVESSGGRADGISSAARTGAVNAFCKTIQNGGYKAGVYANKTWFTSKMNAPSLSGYKIWLAQYAAAPTYTATRHDLWQYTSKGKVSGISGNVDMNISYLGY